MDNKSSPGEPQRFTMQNRETIEERRKRLFPGSGSFLQTEKKKDEIREIMEESDPGMAEYNTVKWGLVKDIAKQYKGAKRRIFYKKVERKVPIIVDETVERKKIGEHGPILSTLEEKLISNPEERNIRVQRVPQTQKKIRFTIKYIDEALPPQPVVINIMLPIGLYIWKKLEEKDSNNKWKYMLQNLALLFEALQTMKEQIKEPLTIHLECEAIGGSLSEKERELRSTETLTWLKKYIPLIEKLWVTLCPSLDTTDFAVALYECDTTMNLTRPHDNKRDLYRREKNMLVNILGKEMRYIQASSNSTKNQLFLNGPLHESEKTIRDWLEKRMKELFTL